MKKALRFRKAFFGAKFANKAEPATLNRATGVVLVMLGVAILASIIYKHRKRGRSQNWLRPLILSGGYACFASPSGKMILLTKKNITIEIPPFNTVVPML